MFYKKLFFIFKICTLLGHAPPVVLPNVFVFPPYTSYTQWKAGIIDKSFRTFELDSITVYSTFEFFFMLNIHAKVINIAI